MGGVVSASTVSAVKSFHGAAGFSKWLSIAANARGSLPAYGLLRGT